MLEELRQKPKSVRNQYAFWGALFLTFAIGAVWVVALSVRFGGEPVVPNEIKENSGAFSQFYDEATANLSEIFSTIKNPPTDAETAVETASSSEDASTSTVEAEEKSSGKAIQIVTSSSTASTTKSE